MLEVLSLSLTECTKSLETLTVSSELFNKLALCTTVERMQGESANYSTYRYED